MKEKVSDLKADQSSSDSAVSSLEDALSDKDRTIERLKGQRDRDDKEKKEEIEHLEKLMKDTKTKMEALQKELQEKEVLIYLYFNLLNTLLGSLRLVGFWNPGFFFVVWTPKVRFECNCRVYNLTQIQCFHPCKLYFFTYFVNFCMVQWGY